MLLLTFSKPGIYVAIWKCTGFVYQGQGVGRILKIFYFLEYYIGMYDWPAVMSDVGALMYVYVILRKAEECVS
jgi:hypothetical protein